MWLTRLSIKNLPDAVKRQILETCQFCVYKDKFKSFAYELSPSGDFVTIISPDKDTAFKRGMFFKKRFNVYFNVEKKKQNVE